MAPSMSVNTELPAEDIIPTIDFGVLVNGTPDQRMAMIQALAKACEDWGLFQLVNHGMPDRLKYEMFEAYRALFDLPSEEKGKYKGTHVLDPIRIGTGFNAKDKGDFWREYAKIFVHPEFHSVQKPLNFRDISKEFSECARAICLELLRALWVSLGVEESRAKEALELDSCYQIMVGNLYRPYENPNEALGLLPHSDHGLLTFLIQNGVDGLQIKRKDRWIDVKPVPNSIIINTGDHLEIASNGKYKSVLHKALRNSEVARMSIASVIGPSLDAIVEPFSELVSGDSPAAFRGLKYWDFLHNMQSNSLVDKEHLNYVRLHTSSTPEEAFD